MALTVTMPQLGESVTEGTIARWLKQPGEFVSKYESIAEVVTDKVNAEIPSPADGSMGEHIAKEGDVVAVGQPICTIETVESAQQRSAWAQPTLENGTPSSEPQPSAAAATDGSASQEQAPTPAPAPASAPAPEAEAQPSAAPAPTSAPTPVPKAQPSEAPAPTSAARTAATPAAAVDTTGYHLTPAVRELVKQHGVDLKQITGTGIGGRIT